MVVDTILYITDTWRFVFFSNDSSGMWLEGRTRHRGLHCGRCLHLRAPEGACRHSGRARSRPPLCYSAPARLEVFSECVAMGALQCRIKVHLTLLSRFLKGTLTTPNCSVAGTLEPTRCMRTLRSSSSSALDWPTSKDPFIPWQGQAASVCGTDKVRGR